EIVGIIGVFKAYSTRVGAGPLTTELDDDVGEDIRGRAWEYGTTTGRPRRVGWFDGLAARYSATVNGFTSAVLTRLDVLDGIDPVKICTAYEADGKQYIAIQVGLGGAWPQWFTDSTPELKTAVPSNVLYVFAL
ncbi:MAG: adenylosuccinate synthetase, partial [Rhodospirillales bacterium]|nr:adenylosuccinate synthetase [Rhodospirillales bacterium]